MGLHLNFLILRKLLPAQSISFVANRGTSNQLKCLEAANVMQPMTIMIVADIDLMLP